MCRRQRQKGVELIIKDERGLTSILHTFPKSSIFGDVLGKHESIRCSGTLVVFRKPPKRRKRFQYAFWMIRNKSGCNKLCFQRMKQHFAKIESNDGIWRSFFFSAQWRKALIVLCLVPFIYTTELLSHICRKLQFDIVWIWVEKEKS